MPFRLDKNARRRANYAINNLSEILKYNIRESNPKNDGKFTFCYYPKIKHLPPPEIAYEIDMLIKNLYAELKDCKITAITT